MKKSLLDPSEDAVIARVSPSGIRRAIGVALLMFLGIMLVALGLGAEVDNIVGRALSVTMGLATLWLSYRLYTATAVSVELTRKGLRDDRGREICAFDNIASVEGGAFALRPSNGFMVKLAEPRKNAWAPGLWWRVGRRVGIGGITSPGEAKAMVEALTILLAEKRGEL